MEYGVYVFLGVIVVVAIKIVKGKLKATWGTGNDEDSAVDDMKSKGLKGILFTRKEDE